MSEDDNLSISFASSMGIENIRDEEYSFRNRYKNSLHTDLDELDKSIDADFEEYMRQARRFPFIHSRGSPSAGQVESDVQSIRSDYDMVSLQNSQEEEKESELEQEFEEDLEEELEEELETEQEFEEDLEEELDEELEEEEQEEGSLEDAIEEQPEDYESWNQHLADQSAEEDYNLEALLSPTHDRIKLGISQHGGRADNFVYNDGSSRLTSPGQYFRNRSLPLDSFNSMWQKQDLFGINVLEEEDHNHLNISQVNASNNRPVKKRTIIEQKLSLRFKSLPQPLNLLRKHEAPYIKPHSYTQNQQQNVLSSTRQRLSMEEQLAETNLHDVRSLSNTHSFKSSTSEQQSQYSAEENNGVLIEPSFLPLHFLCEISPKTIYAKVAHLKLTNPSSVSTKSFIFYTLKNLLEFEQKEGILLEHQATEIKVKVRSSALLSYQKSLKSQDELPSLSDQILVLIDHQYVTELKVNIDFMHLEDEEEEEEDKAEVVGETGRPKCKFCALEKGYPIHCL